MINIDKLIVGPLSTNCYLVYDSDGNTVIIDPGGDLELIVDRLKRRNLKPIAIIATHAHFDHILEVESLIRRYNIDFYLHKLDVNLLEYSARMYKLWFGVSNWKPPKPTVIIDNEPTLEFTRSLRFKVLHTPGHSPGSICLIIDNHIFTGDTLFQGSIGRVDLEGGSMESMRLSLKKLMKLPDNMIVHPGHGPDTTIGIEKRTNIYLTMY